MLLGRGEGAVTGSALRKKKRLKCSIAEKKELGDKDAV